jgi:hypothetical protein
MRAYFSSEMFPSRRFHNLTGVREMLIQKFSLRYWETGTQAPHSEQANPRRPPQWRSGGGIAIRDKGYPYGVVSGVTG